MDSVSCRSGGTYVSVTKKPYLLELRAALYHNCEDPIKKPLQIEYILEGSHRTESGNLKSTPATRFNPAPYDLMAVLERDPRPEPLLKVRLSRFGQFLMKSGYTRSTTISRIFGNLALLRLSLIVTGPLRLTLRSSNVLRFGNRIRVWTKFFIRPFGAPLKYRSTERTLWLHVPVSYVRWKYNHTHWTWAAMVGFDKRYTH